MLRSGERGVLLKSAREILIDQLHRLMIANGWRRADGEWDISALHKKTGGSRRWLYKVLRGETNFGIDEYERILQKGFNSSFAVIMSGLNISTIPRDVEDLYDKLKTAIGNTQKTGTLEALRWVIYGLADKTALDRALQEKARGDPRPINGRGTEPKEGTRTGRPAKPQTKKTSSI